MPVQLVVAENREKRAWDHIQVCQDEMERQFVTYKYDLNTCRMECTLRAIFAQCGCVMFTPPPYLTPRARKFKGHASYSSQFQGHTPTGGVVWYLGNFPLKRGLCLRGGGGCLGYVCRPLGMELYLQYLCCSTGISVSPTPIVWHLLPMSHYKDTTRCRLVYFWYSRLGMRNKQQTATI